MNRSRGVGQISSAPAAPIAAIITFDFKTCPSSARRPTREMIDACGGRSATPAEDLDWYGMAASRGLTIDELLAAARAGVPRVLPEALAGEQVAGALVVDIRPVEQRHRDGELPGALVIDRNVLEWRLAPSSPNRVVDLDNQVTALSHRNEELLAELEATRAALRQARIAAGAVRPNTLPVLRQTVAGQSVMVWRPS